MPSRHYFAKVGCEKVISIPMNEIDRHARRNVILHAEIINRSGDDIRNTTALLFSAIECCDST